MLNSALLGTHIDLFEEKSVQFYFLKNIMQSILLYYMVFFGGGDAVRTCVEMLGRRGGANFLLKCHGLCPICLTFLVGHFFTYIYNILNLWKIPLRRAGGREDEGVHTVKYRPGVPGGW